VSAQPVRRHRRLERPRERVLTEAWNLLVERGLADLTLSELGRRLDTSAGHLSYYFGSKDGLLLDVLRWSEDELAAERATIMTSDTPVEERVRRFCELYLPRAAGDPRWLLWAELWPRVTRDPALKGAQVEFDSAWHEDLVQLLREMVPPGHDVDVTVLTRRTLALLDGLAIGLLTGEEGLTREAAWEHVRVLLPGA
jgi:AcrR family transcriptional regulator